MVPVKLRVDTRDASKGPGCHQLPDIRKVWSKAAILVYAEHHTILLSESNHLRSGLDVGHKWLL